MCGRYAFFAPAVLPESSWEAWLDPTGTETGKLSALLRPCDPESLEFWRVSRRVNQPRNEGPELVAPERSGP